MKKRALIVIGVVLISGTLVFADNSTKDKNEPSLNREYVDLKDISNVKDYNNKVKEAFDNLLNKEKKYEYIKRIYCDGSYLERYKDLSNGNYRDDGYDKEGKFVTRDLYDSKDLQGKSSRTTMFKNKNGDWEGYKYLFTNEEERAGITSDIDDICKYYIYISQTEKDNYTHKEEVDGLIMYTCDDNIHSVYVNPDTNMISKIEDKSNHTHNHKICFTKGFEFEIPDTIEKEDLSINAKNKENIDLSKIKLSIEKEEDVKGAPVG